MVNDLKIAVIGLTTSAYLLIAEKLMSLDSFFQSMNTYGVPMVISGVFVGATIYILHRLFAKKDGILTVYADSIRVIQEKNAETQEAVAGLMKKFENRLGKIETNQSRLMYEHWNPHSNFSTVIVVRCFRHACDILRAMSNALDIQDKTDSLIDVMIRELDSTKENQMEDETFIPPGK